MPELSAPWWGAYLTGSGQEVWLIGRSAGHVQAVAEQGLRAATHRGELCCRITATNCPEEFGTAEVVILLVKGTSTRGAVDNIRAVSGPETVILTLQNGLGNLDILKECFPAERLAYGCVMMGSILKGPGRVRETESEFASRVYFGSENQALAPLLNQVAADLISGGLQARYREDIDRIAWEKLAGNCADNLCCAIARRSVDVWLSPPAGIELARLLRKEACAVTQALGVDLKMSDLAVARPVELEAGQTTGTWLLLCRMCSPGAPRKMPF